MFTTSQKYRSANNHLCYQPCSSSEYEQLDSTTWQQNTTHAPYDGSTLAASLHHTQDVADTIVHRTPPTPQGWPTGHSRQNNNLGWSQSVPAQNIVPRPLDPYGCVVGPVSVLHQNHEMSRQHHRHGPAAQQDPSLIVAVPSYKSYERYNPAAESTVFMRRRICNASSQLIVPGLSHRLNRPSFHES